ncbi:MAG: glycosyltransferase, partial [Ilumatobacteraceae bacterium]
LRARGLRCTLEIVGPGDFEASLAAYAHQLGVRDQVCVVGALPPALVAEQMRAADIVCLPSMAEGLPVTLMEAMVVGTPVVASGISGIPELVEHGVTGLLVVPVRPDLLADAWALLAGDVALRARLAQAGAQRVRALHNLVGSAQALSALFCAAASRPATTDSAAAP